MDLMRRMPPASAETALNAQLSVLPTTRSTSRSRYIPQTPTHPTVTQCVFSSHKISKFFKLSITSPITSKH